MFDYATEIMARNDRLIQIKSDPKVLQASRIYYATNPINFIEDWAWTFDPRAATPFMPFLLFEKQKEFIGWLGDRLNNKEDGLVEKSRDMGVTWLCCAFSVWAWVFIDAIKISFGSRKEKLVDELGNPDSIFEKIRLILRMMPPEYLPIYQDMESGSYTTYKESKDATYLKIINRKNGSAITGESGDNIGRGGRSSLYFKDESAFYERPGKIDAALSQNSDVKIDVSTPNGSGNLFYKKRHSGTVPVFTFHWRDDPRKSQEWYDSQCVRLNDPAIVAQEIDIDYNASLKGMCIKVEWIEAAVDFHKRFNVNLEGAKVSGFDVADEGGDENVHIMRHGIGTVFIDAWKKGTTGQSMLQCYAQAEERGAELINYDNIGVGAGAKSKAAELAEIKTNPIEMTGVNAGSTGLTGEWEPEKLNSDMFLNFKAQMWWTVRRRFIKTWQHVTGQEQHPLDELISIPNHLTLKLELSQPRHFRRESGKYQIEPKEMLLKRGIKSHNYADAFVLSYSPVQGYEGGAW